MYSEKMVLMNFQVSFKEIELVIAISGWHCLMIIVKESLNLL